MAGGKIFAAVVAAGMAVGALTVDSPSANASARCDSYARQQASRHANGTGVLGGAAGGAIVGAIIGGIVDDGRGAGRGAAIGAGAGALGGALHESASYRDAYNYYYRHCIETTRAPVRARYQDGRRPKPWTRAWYRYCADKYRSFNPNTGKYLTYSGRYRMCR